MGGLHLNWVFSKIRKTNFPNLRDKKFITVSIFQYRKLSHSFEVSNTWTDFLVKANNAYIREVVYMTESIADKEVKGLVPQKSDAPYYLSLAGFWGFLIGGLIIAAMISPYLVFLVFIILLGCCFIQLMYIMRSFKRDKSASGTAGNVIGILILVFELLISIGVGY